MEKKIIILVIIAAAVWAVYNWLKLQPVKQAVKEVQDNKENGLEILNGAGMQFDLETIQNRLDLDDVEVAKDDMLDVVVPSTATGSAVVFYNLVSLRLGKTVDMNRLNAMQGDQGKVTIGTIKEMMLYYPDLVYQAKNYNL